MKTIASIAVIVLISSSLVGCGDTKNQANNDQPPVQTQQAGNPVSKPDENNPSSTQEDHNNQDTNLSRYFKPGQSAEINSTPEQTTWKMGDVEFVAKKSTTSITAIQVSHDGSPFDINIPRDISENGSEITSVALSSSGDYLSINIFITNVGNQLIVVDLKNGESNTINNLTGLSYETIHAYNWSPMDNRLAFAYGDTSSSNLAVLDVNLNELLKIQNNKTLINTLFIMWEKQGDGFDFISETSSDQFDLLRYEESTENVTELTQIPSGELSKYSEFGPNNL
ncbi:hypothetical protein [Paenibacillus tengchongensis]|uniref:hypothetical protein n=1 Tax=Paenibacillus tengchongensis TaxID=2608684 RepID=UPI00124CF38B|nr:hypothetical protein [Paenibacillus tengchongensis]